MKTWLFSTFSLLFVYTSTAQQEVGVGIPPEEDNEVVETSIEFSPSCPKLGVIWQFDLTYNDWTGAGLQPFRMQGPSLGANISHLKRIKLTPNGVLSLATGISFGWHRLTHDLSITHDPTNKSTIVGTQGDFVDGKNRLISHQWSIPIEFHINMFQSTCFLHLGGKLGYQSRLFEKGRNDDWTKYTSKNKYNSDKEPWIYSVHARVGFRHGPTLYGSYNLNSLFRNSQSTKVNLFEIGISLLPSK